MGTDESYVLVAIGEVGVEAGAEPGAQGEARDTTQMLALEEVHLPARTVSHEVGEDGVVAEAVRPVGGALRRATVLIERGEVIVQGAGGAGQYLRQPGGVRLQVDGSPCHSGVAHRRPVVDLPLWGIEEPPVVVARQVRGQA